MAALLQHWDAVITDEGEEGGDLGWQLVQRARSTLESCKKDLVGSAWNGPLHGILTAIRHCLREQLDESQIEVLLSVLEDTTDLMLSLLTGKGKTKEKSSSCEENADFQQMAEAISKLVAGEEGETITIPESHQRVLSMAWHCLKEASLLAAHLGEVALQAITTLFIWR